MTNGLTGWFWGYNPSGHKGNRVAAIYAVDGELQKDKRLEPPRIVMAGSGAAARRGIAAGRGANGTAEAKRHRSFGGCEQSRDRGAGRGMACKSLDLGGRAAS